MKSSLRQIKRVGLACVALGSIAVSQQSLAAGTLAGTEIENTATVNYQVGGVAQDAIDSNTTSFVVDNMVNLTVTRLDSDGVEVGPGGTGYVTTFRLTNTGNKAQGYVFNGSAAGTGDANQPDSTAWPFLTPGANDSFDMLGTGTYVESSAACSESDPAPGYNAGTDSARNVATLQPDTCVYVYVVANADTQANGAVNGAVAVVTLSAQAREATTLAALTANTGADTAAEDIVFADAGNDAIQAANSAYVVSSATITVAKSSAVISDPVNSSNFKAIPGAVVEFTIRLTNDGGDDADGVVITDTLPATGITFWPGQYNGNASDVSITVGGGAPTFCVAEVTAGPSADGCYLTPGGVLTVGAPAITQVAPGGVATEVAVRFRMRINP